MVPTTWGLVVKRGVVGLCMQACMVAAQDNKVTDTALVSIALCVAFVGAVCAFCLKYCWRDFTGRREREPTPDMPFRSPAEWLRPLRFGAKKVLNVEEVAVKKTARGQKGALQTPRKALHINRQVEPWDPSRGEWVEDGVFISCDLLEGLEFARALQLALADHGVEAYINYYQTSVMEDFVRCVGRKIRSCHMFVGLGTPRYAVEDERNKGTWEELGSAVTLSKRIELVEMCAETEWRAQHKGRPPPVWSEEWDPTQPQPPYDLGYYIAHVARSLHEDCGRLPPHVRYEAPEDGAGKKGAEVLSIGTGDVERLPGMTGAEDRV